MVAFSDRGRFSDRWREWGRELCGVAHRFQHGGVDHREQPVVYDAVWLVGRGAEQTQFHGLVERGRRTSGSRGIDRIEQRYRIGGFVIWIRVGVGLCGALDGGINLFEAESIIDQSMAAVRNADGLRRFDLPVGRWGVGGV